MSRTATKKSKFNVAANPATRTSNGIVFDSKMEKDFYDEWLLPRVESGEIKEYELQKKYLLIPSFEYEGKKIRPIEYRSDFYFVTKNGTEVVIDVKGMATPDAKMKRKLMWFVYPKVKFYWVTKSLKYGGWVEYDELQRKRRQNKKEKK